MCLQYHDKKTTLKNLVKQINQVHSKTCSPETIKNNGISK